uniref:sperm-associated antigen 7 homolog isoform X1 n=1 Tax=Styela clava TaxID=7725 RepID=UPI001939F0F9|nr:sperm-associated antigen 7 homolog isoform X1 [Styela clava]
MDLLGSILGNMEKPPSVSDEQRKKEKANKKKLEKLQDEERKGKAKFRKDTEDRISKFINDVDKTRLKFEPMNKIQRTIVHDVAEIAGLIGQAFGKEEDGRYIMLYKKDYPPTEEELSAYRNGEEWDPSKQAKESKKQTEQVHEQPLDVAKTSKTTNVEPSTNYRDKYSHIIGTTSAKDAARKTEANKAFGMVPSENKRDVRSIEETMNEIRKKKRQKIENDEES